ncbi:hypothetical protein BJX70DRAFT_353288 [Aspergillus crustosus]
MHGLGAGIVILIVGVARSTVGDLDSWRLIDGHLFLRSQPSDHPMNWLVDNNRGSEMALAQEGRVSLSPRRGGFWCETSSGSIPSKEMQLMQGLQRSDWLGRSAIVLSLRECCDDSIRGMMKTGL